jgi:hypothetical protein
MWRAHSGFRFCLFFHKTYCYIFLMFYNYTIFILMRCLHVNRNLMTLCCLTNCCPNYLPVYMKVNYFLICVYLKCFCKLAIRKIFMSSLFSPVKKRNIFCSDRKMYRPGLSLTWVPVWDSAHQVHSRVSNVNFVVCGRGGSINISCMPRCRFIVLNMYLQ